MPCVCRDPQRPERGVKTLELEAIVNLGPMEEQQAFLDAEASLSPLLVSSSAVAASLDCPVDRGLDTCDRPPRIVSLCSGNLHVLPTKF